ncbi:hypothetical protein ABFV80_002716 [Vandammella animalimorsus]|uniref:hypothetical protein n=1 Tax=Vandammella animalimorsus TaxID=2029117 RepID=UPI000F5FA7D2|nr:hypothetical protein EII18_01840 [Comamonadaceae bacterium OH3737_COT-264]
MSGQTLLLIALGATLLASWGWVILLAMRRGTGWGAVAIFFSPIVALSLLVRQPHTTWKAAVLHLLAFACFWTLAIHMLAEVGRDFARMQPSLLDAARERCTQHAAAASPTAQACLGAIERNRPACIQQAARYWPQSGDLTLIDEATKRYTACLLHQALPAPPAQ